MFYQPLKLKEYLLSRGSALHRVLLIVGATEYVSFIMLLEELDPSSLT